MLFTTFVYVYNKYIHLIFIQETQSNRSEDFTIDSDKESTDDEETLEEQEKAEGKVDHSQELAELEV